MDIIKIEFSGEELPVRFPFEALVDAMGEDNFDKFLHSYTSLKYQLKIFKIGLYYGGGPDKTDGQLMQLANANPYSFFHVREAFEKEFNVFASGYFNISEDLPAEKSRGQAKKKEEGKALASGK